MEILPETLIVVAIVIFVGYTILGATGFGASPVTIPVLAQILPLRLPQGRLTAMDRTVFARKRRSPWSAVERSCHSSPVA